MVNKYTYLLPASKEELEKLYGLGMTQKEIAFDLGISQKVVWTAMRRLKIIVRIPKKRNQFGENNDNWKGNQVGYAMFHRRVENLRGKPRKCEICGTENAKRYEWANLTKNYSDSFDYERMCKSCHSKYDGVIKNISIRGGDAQCLRN